VKQEHFRDTGVVAEHLFSAEHVRPVEVPNHLASRQIPTISEAVVIFSFREQEWDGLSSISPSITFWNGPVEFLVPLVST
jgi:hypothetical protein